MAPGVALSPALRPFVLNPQALTLVGVQGVVASKSHFESPKGK
jgi:hypothetical protein